MTAINILGQDDLTQRLPPLEKVATPARPLNEGLWQLLTKAEPLTPAEWALVEEYERCG